MATRFYPYSQDTPDVSPTVDGVWDETASLVRRKIALDTPYGNTWDSNEDTDTVDGVGYYLLYQFVSEPLDAISATFAVTKAAFRCFESDAKLNGFVHIVFRKCDGDGSNPTTIDSITDDTEFDDAIVNRFTGSSNLTDQSLSQGDRLVIELGFYSSATKDTLNIGRIYLKDDHATTDLPENDTEATACNSWIETGDTFTEASGEAAFTGLGPMFAFA